MLGAEQIDNIVAEVIRRLQARGAVASGSPAAPTSAGELPAGTLRVSERLITWEQLKGRLTGVRHLRVPAKCVITPAAHDGLREAGITVSHEQNKVRRGGTPLLLAIGAADVDLSGVVEQLGPQCGVAGRVQETDPVKLVTAAAAQAKPDTRVVLLTRQAALCLILANRRRAVRAIAAASPQALAQAAADTSANWLVLDPTGRSELELLQLIQEFLRHGGATAPPALR